MLEIPQELLDPDVIELDFLDVLDFLTAYGSSLILNWGEEGTWEVEWITGGIRYVGVSKSVSKAIAEMMRKLKNG